MASSFFPYSNLRAYEIPEKDWVRSEGMGVMGLKIKSMPILTFCRIQIKKWLLPPISPQKLFKLSSKLSHVVCVILYHIILGVIFMDTIEILKLLFYLCHQRLSSCRTGSHSSKYTPNPVPLFPPWCCNGIHNQASQGVNDNHYFSPLLLLQFEET